MNLDATKQTTYSQYSKKLQISWTKLPTISFQSTKGITNRIEKKRKEKNTKTPGGSRQITKKVDWT
jgi:hypothetical protein